MSNSSNNSSILISQIYKSRQILLNLLIEQNYTTKEYSNFSINEINSMYQNAQLDMLLEKEPKEGERSSKIYVNYYLGKSLRPQNITDIIDDLYNMEEILTTNDTLMIIIKDEMNETIINLLKHIYERDQRFIIVQSIKHLQYNILNNVLVPSHRVLLPEEVLDVKKKYNITDDFQFPDISRFDPVAQIIGIRPGQVCEIIRPSKTAIDGKYYRICTQ
jgi:DNA-directed RNA polymerase subunit H (RpoH/RPB5)